MSISTVATKSTIVRSPDHLEPSKDLQNSQTPEINQDSIEFNRNQLYGIKQFLKLLLPHVALFLLLLSFILTGALFLYLAESPHEKEAIETRLGQISRIKERHLIRMGRFVPLKDRVKFMIMFEKYTEELLEAENGIRAPRNYTNGRESLWTYRNSVFFALSVITTIGNTKMIPVTTFGRFFTIIYAIFGIPLLLVAIADIGKFFSDAISWFQRKMYHLKRKWSSKRRDSFGLTMEQAQYLSEIDQSSNESDYARLSLFLVSIFVLLYLILGCLIIKMIIAWQYFDVFYFSFNFVATIGFNNFIPQSNLTLIFVMFYAIFGLALRCVWIDLLGNAYIRKMHEFGRCLKDHYREHKFLKNRIIFMNHEDDIPAPEFKLDQAKKAERESDII